MLLLACLLLSASGALGRVCQHLLPGLDKQMQGVDITSLELMPVEPLRDDGGFQSPIITYTCNQRKQYPVGQVDYDLPDQVWHVTELPTGSLSTSVEVAKTTSEARNSMAVNAGVSGGFGRFAFSASTTFSRTQQSLATHDKTVETATAYFGARRVELQHTSHLALGNVAQEQLNLLPAQYSSNPTGYENFVKQFGTHYATVGKFGGLMMQYMETSSDYTESHGEQNLEVQAEASFGMLIKAHGGYSSSSTNADTSFTHSTHKEVRYYGGTANLLESSGIASWQPTISASPWLFSTQLAPITDLVRDAHKKSALNTAIHDYVLRTYLTVELPRLLQTLPLQVQRESSARRLFDKIDTMARTRPLVEADVLYLGNEVEYTYRQLFLTYHRSDDNFHQVNNYDQQAIIKCPAAQAITHIWSQHDNGHEDRIWKFGCNYVEGLGLLTDCHETDYVNGWHQPFTYSCPHNGVIKGWRSVHDNHYEDRRFKFTCCQVYNAETYNCGFTGFLNNYDQTLDFKVIHPFVLKGVSSVYDNSKRDRRFKFQTCYLNYPDLPLPTIRPIDFGCNLCGPDD